MKLNSLLNFLLVALIISCNTTFSKNIEVHDNLLTKDKTAKIPILKNQNDSLNYTLGLANGDGIRSRYLKEDNAEIQIITLINAINNSYENIDKSQIYNLGIDVGKSLKKQIAAGLFGVSNLELNEVWLKEGLIDALHGTYTLMQPKIAEQFIQETMVKLKNGSYAFQDEITNKKLNYAFGMTNGVAIKDYYIKGDSVSIKISSFLSGVEDGMKENGKNNSVELFELGTKIGSSFKEFEKSGLMGDSALKVDIDLIIQGLENGLKGINIILTPEKAQIYLQTTMQKRQTKKNDTQYESNIITGEKFLSENAKRIGVVTTPSGLQYEIIKKGFGKYPSENNRVKVNYHGTLLDGTVFDSSIERKEPIVISVNQCIKGWTEALRLMQVGSKYKLYIPENLAYGSQDQGKIKPYSFLIFELELLSIEQ